MGEGPAAKGRRRTKAELAEAEARGRKAAGAPPATSTDLEVWPVMEDYFTVGNRPLKIGDAELAPGEEIPQEVFANCHRTDAWERSRRIVRHQRPLNQDLAQVSA